MRRLLLLLALIVGYSSSFTPSFTTASSSKLSSTDHPKRKDTLIGTGTQGGGSQMGGKVLGGVRELKGAPVDGIIALISTSIPTDFFKLLCLVVVFIRLSSGFRA